LDEEALLIWLWKKSNKTQQLIQVHSTLKTLTAFYENPDYYEIQIVEEEVEGGHKIGKITGKIYDVYHEHLILRPKERDEEKFEEIED